MKPLVFAWLWISIAVPGVTEVIYLEPHDIYLDPPEDWRFYGEVDSDRWTLGNPRGDAFLQFRWFGDMSPVETLNKARTQIQAQGENEPFQWNTSAAELGNWDFSLNNEAERCWVLAVAKNEGTALFLAFTPSTNWERQQDTLISALNSVATSTEGRRSKGSISSYYILAAQAPPTRTLKLDLSGQAFSWTLSEANIESQKIVIDRESRILKPYGATPLGMKAWQRFYRQIFREIYPDLDDLAQAWKAGIQTSGGTETDLPARILAWIQKIEYDRKKDLSDLSTPWELLSSGKGDCDSRTLVFSGLLGHLGIEAILMVSLPYDHGIAALDLPGAGARFPFDGKNYLVAECTAPVALGQIAQDMADPGKWMGVDLWGKP